MNRRTLLVAASTLIPAGLLAACQNGKAPSASQVATDVNLIATAMGPVVAALATTPNVSPALVTKAQGYLAIIQADAAKIAAATLNPPAGTVQEIVQVVQALAGIVGSIPALAPYAVVIQAAVALAPVMLAAVGVQVTGAAPSMTPTQARAILAISAQ